MCLNHIYAVVFFLFFLSKNYNERKAGIEGDMVMLGVVFVTKQF